MFHHSMLICEQACPPVQNNSFNCFHLLWVTGVRPEVGESIVAELGCGLVGLSDPYDMRGQGTGVSG